MEKTCPESCKERREKGLDGDKPPSAPSTSKSDKKKKKKKKARRSPPPLAAAARRRRSPPPLAAAASVDASPCSPPHLLRAQKKGAKDGDKEEM